MPDLARRALPRRVFARERPSALPLLGGRQVAAFTPAPVIERWNADAAGVRPAAVAAGDNVITMFDTIGYDYWTDGGITAKNVTRQLRAIGDRPVEVQINSNGGDMFEGIAIYNVLREHSQEVTIKVMGMAASAASIITMAGDKVEIGAASFLMIHNCWVIVAGNRIQLRDAADWLEPFDQAMADVYAARTGRKAAEITKWLDDETYMSGTTAIERGFADSLLGADQTVVDEQAKSADRQVNELRALEVTLVSAGYSRAQARARISAIKGKPGAAREPEAMPGAGLTTAMTGALAGLLDSIRS